MPSIKTEPCPECKANGGDYDGDNLHTFEDGGKYCFACGNIEGKSWMLSGKIPKEGRGITYDVFQFCNYRVGKYTGVVRNRLTKEYYEVVNEPCQIETYLNAKRQPVRQKLRFKNKDMKLLGNRSDDMLPLWGMSDYTPTDKLFCVVTEAAIDRMSVIKVQGIKYPVVSLIDGAGSAVKAIKKALPWLMQWKYIVLAFDNDEAGHRATELASELFEPDKVRLARFPNGYKDANDMLKAGLHEELGRVIWNAECPKMSQIVTAGDILDSVLVQPERGLPLPWESLEQIMYGLRMGEITIWVGPPGCGKTEVIKDLVSSMLQHMNVFVCSLEQTPEDTLRRYAGAQLGLKLQKPGEQWPVEEIKKAVMSYDNKVFLYKPNSSLISIPDIFRSITFLAKTRNCKLVIIDNLKSLRVVMNKEALIDFCQSLRGLVTSLGIHVMLVSHVAKNTIKRSTHVGFSSQVQDPHGNLTEDQIKNTLNKFALDWEDGRRPGSSDIEGGNDTEAIADYVFGLSRNKKSLDPRVSRTIVVEPLKYGRIDDEHARKVFKLYRDDTGKLIEIDYTKIMGSNNSSDVNTCPTANQCPSEETNDDSWEQSSEGKDDEF